VIETARRAVPEHLAFIAGAGQQSTRGTIKEIERAAAGAEAVLVITPSFINRRSLRTRWSALRVSRRRFAVPIILYSMPDLTGIKIEPATVAAE